MKLEIPQGKESQVTNFAVEHKLSQLYSITRNQIEEHQIKQ